MRKKIHLLCLVCLTMLFCGVSFAQGSAGTLKISKNVQLGAIGHSLVEIANSEGSDYGLGFKIYRARILFGAQLSKKGNVFIETELSSTLGATSGTESKTIPGVPVILDAQYEYVFSSYFSVIFGQQLVSATRNGLQGAAGLMADDFTFFQYPYNLFPDQPLQNFLGRDLGVNFRGFLSDKLEYRAGVFTGGKIGDIGPLRFVGRLAYNFLDAEKSFYYNGTNLGKGKTVALGLGIDTQDEFSNVSTDLFVDIPAGDAGSLTFNGAVAFLSGSIGNITIADQTNLLATLGYYFKKLKIQPWVKLEQQTFTDVDGGSKSNTVIGGGINYFFNDYNTNIRLSYQTTSADTLPTGSLAAASSLQPGFKDRIWLQLQFFIF